MSLDELSALEDELRRLRRENAKLRARLYVTDAVVVAFLVAGVLRLRSLQSTAASGAWGRPGRSGRSPWQSPSGSPSRPSPRSTRSSGTSPTTMSPNGFGESQNDARGCRLPRLGRWHDRSRRARARRLSCHVRRRRHGCDPAEEHARRVHALHRDSRRGVFRTLVPTRPASAPDQGAHLQVSQRPGPLQAPPRVSRQLVGVHASPARL